MLCFCWGPYHENLIFLFKYLQTSLMEVIKILCFFKYCSHISCFSFNKSFSHTYSHRFITAGLDPFSATCCKITEMSPIRAVFSSLNGNLPLPKHTSSHIIAPTQLQFSPCVASDAAINPTF